MFGSRQYGVQAQTKVGVQFIPPTIRIINIMEHYFAWPFADMEQRLSRCLGLSQSLSDHAIAGTWLLSRLAASLRPK